MSSLFSDLLVIDCASFIAGPAAATIMSDFGARVIKIEPPGVGDSYRQLMKLPGVPQADRDYYWALDSRNKESLALDLKHDAARPIFEKLVRKADVFITNYPAPIRRKLHLTSDDVMALSPAHLRIAVDGMKALAKNGLRYPIAPYGIQNDVRSGLGASYAGGSD